MQILFNSLFFFVIYTWFGAAAAHTHPPQSSCPGIVSEADVIHEAHEVIEGEPKATRAQEYLSKFNLQEKIRDGQVWFRMQKHTEFKDIALDSLMIFGLSHTLEVAAGPLLVTSGVNLDWPLWLTTALGAGGVVISIPGLDPLCLVLLATYGKSKNFQQVVRATRQVLSAPLVAMLPARNPKYPNFPRLLHLPWLADVWRNGTSTLLRYEVKEGDHAFFNFVLKIHRGQLYLQRVEIEVERLDHRWLSALKSFFARLPSPIASELQHTFTTVLRDDAVKARFYHESWVQKGIRHHHVTFRPFAIATGAPGFGSCETLLLSQ